MLGGDLNSKVNLGSYLQKRQQLTAMIVKNQQELDQLADLTELFQCDMEAELNETRKAVDQVKQQIQSRCQKMINSILPEPIICSTPTILPSSRSRKDYVADSSVETDDSKTESVTGTGTG